GKEEGADVSLPVGAVKAVARVVVSGENRERVARFFRGAGIDTEIYPDLASALDDLERHLAGVTVVLFSPGAPSYDQFNNYAERGRYFTERIMRK
ncbi:MAG: UDP-N-acetylmuramoyl-L-alanine--D-glutamate ligase, partial [Bacilli bacterium]